MRQTGVHQTSVRFAQGSVRPDTYKGETGRVGRFAAKATRRMASLPAFREWPGVIGCRRFRTAARWAYAAPRRRDAANRCEIRCVAAPLTGRSELRARQAPMPWALRSMMPSRPRDLPSRSLARAAVIRRSERSVRPGRSPRDSRGRNAFNMELGIERRDPSQAVSTAVELGDGGGALELGLSLDASNLSPVRRSRPLMDLGRPMVTPSSWRSCQPLAGRRTRPRSRRSHMAARKAMSELALITGAGLRQIFLCCRSTPTLSINPPTSDGEGLAEWV